LEPELEDAEKQEKLRKWLPYLWVPPLALVIAMFTFAYCGR